MIRRNCRSPLRFGAVAAALPPALAALADEIEPERYVEQEAVELEPEPTVQAGVEEEVGSEVAKQRDRKFDQPFGLVITRPFGLATTLVGGVFFSPAAWTASLSGAEGVQAARDHFVAPSVGRTSQTPPGDL